MFYCREEELRIMNQRYEKNRFDCIVIYGRKRKSLAGVLSAFIKKRRGCLPMITKEDGAVRLSGGKGFGIGQRLHLPYW